MSGVLEAHLGGRRLSAFIDGELTPYEADRWRTHLLRCPMCTSAVTAERVVRARMRGACTPAPSSHLLASLRVVAMEATHAQPVGITAVDHIAGSTTGARRARRVATMAVVTTTTVVAVAVVSFGLVPGGADGPALTPAAPPTAIDSSPQEPNIVPAALGGTARYGSTAVFRLAWHGPPVGPSRLGGQ